MALDAEGITDAIVSAAISTGLFERVNGHEPKSAPPSAPTASVWFQKILPAVAASGLSVTSALAIWNLRIYTSMRTVGDETDDAIDPNVVSATVTVMGLLGGDFELGGQVRNVDVLGEIGPPLSGEAGYITIGGAMYRCMTITIPCVVNDVWSQAA